VHYIKASGLIHSPIILGDEYL